MVAPLKAELPHPAMVCAWAWLAAAGPRQPEKCGGPELQDRHEFSASRRIAASPEPAAWVASARSIRVLRLLPAMARRHQQARLRLDDRAGLPMLVPEERLARPLLHPPRPSGGPDSCDDGDAVLL